MRYELTVIVAGDLDEKEAGQRLADVKKNLTTFGATDIKEQLAGRQPLAYSIAKQNQGYYGTWEFESTGETVNKIERDLKLGGQVVRWLTVQAYKNPYTIAETPKLSDEARSAEELLRRTSGTTETKKRAPKKGAAEGEAEGADREKQLDDALGKLLSEDETTTTKE
jgi:small subunit ribosomal protein S6